MSFNTCTYRHLQIHKSVCLLRSYMVLDILVSPSFHKQLRKCGVIHFRSPNERCAAMLLFMQREKRAYHATRSGGKANPGTPQAVMRFTSRIYKIIKTWTQDKDEKSMCLCAKGNRDMLARVSYQARTKKGKKCFSFFLHGLWPPRLLQLSSGA